MSAWELQKWNDVLEIRSGRNQKSVECADGKYPILGSAGKPIGYANEYICDAETTVLGRKGTINNPQYVNQPYWNVDTAFGLHAGQKLTPQFLHYFCLSFDFTERDKGSGRPSLVKKDLLEIEMPVPSLEEQNQIVAILDKAFAAINQAQANIEQNIENAKALFQAQLSSVFSEAETWKHMKLKGITSKIGSGATPKGGQASYKTEGISLIRSMNVHDSGFAEKNLAYIDDEQAAKLANVDVFPNDVLLNITGASVARCCIANEAFLPARVNQHVAIIRIDENIVLPKFLHFALTNPQAKSKLLGIGEQGSTRQAITKSQIENFTISFPEALEAQAAITTALDEVRTLSEKLQSSYQKKLVQLDELKQSLLQQAFNGELTQ
jgi:type I restriction enzyme S subunit